MSEQVPSDISDCLVVPKQMANSKRPFDKSRYSHHDFNTDECYVFDCGVELFLWIGNGSSIPLRGTATEFLTKIVPLQARPPWLGLNKLHQGDESEIFKLRFHEWQSVADVDWKTTVAVGEKEQPNTMQIDVKALYSSFPPAMPDLESIKKKISRTKGLIHSLSCYVYSKGRFVTLPAEEIGHFSSKDAYIFLCVTKSDPNPAENEAESKAVAAEIPKPDELQRNEEFIKESAVVHESRRPMSFIYQPSEEIVDGKRDSVSLRLSTLSRSSRNSISRRLSNAARLSETTQSKELSQNLTGTDLKLSLDSPDSLADSTIDLLVSQRLRRSTLSSDISRKASSNEARITSRMDSSESQSQDDEFEDEEMDCTVYSWAGKHCSKLALLTFKFATLVEMQALITDMYDCPLKVVYCESEKEQLPLLACVDNEFIIHRDRARMTGSSSIYRVWTDDYGTTRAMYHDVDQDNIQLLDERFVFLFKGFMWTGKSSIGVAGAESISKKIRDVRFNGQGYQFINQGDEPVEFWEILTVHEVKKQDLLAGLKNSSLALPRTGRALRCSCSRGYFLVQELSSIVQCDLERDSCVIIDTGREYGCFLWVGYFILILIP